MKKSDFADFEFYESCIFSTVESFIGISLRDVDFEVTELLQIIDGRESAFCCFISNVENVKEMTMIRAKKRLIGL